MTELPAKTDDTPKWAADLSLRERRFVQEFIVDLNGRQAAVRAGLGKSVKSATEIASKMRKRPAVAAAISALMAERNGVTGAAVVGELGAIAFSRINSYLKIENGRLVLKVASLEELPDEAVAAIARLRERVDPDTGAVTIDVELHEKIPALKLLGSAAGVFVDRTEISGPNGGPIPLEQADPGPRIVERMNALRQQIASGGMAGRSFEQMSRAEQLAFLQLKADEVKAERAKSVAEIEPPPKRITSPQPRPEPPIIDGEISDAE